MDNSSLQSIIDEIVEIRKAKGFFTPSYIGNAERVEQSNEAERMIINIAPVIEELANVVECARDGDVAAYIKSIDIVMNSILMLKNTSIEYDYWKKPLPKSTRMSVNEAMRGKIVLVMSELGELLLECPVDDKKSKHKKFAEELADVIIRCFDIGGSLGIPLEEEIKRKMDINSGRVITHGRKAKL